MIIWMYFKISLVLGIFWWAIALAFLPNFALLIGLVTFVMTFAGLTFNYGAHR